MALFAERGYEAVGVQELASVAGVTKPTLYHFFGSKAGLLKAVFDEFGSPLDDAVAAAADYQGDLPLTLDRIAEAYFAFSALQPAYYRFELGAYLSARESESHRAVAACHVRRLASIVEAFRKAGGDHGNMRGRERAFAVSFLGHLNGTIAMQFDDKIAITPQVRHEVIRQFSHGIYS